MHISGSLNNKYSILPRSVAKRASIEETSLSNFTTIASSRGCKRRSLASRKLAEFWPQPSRCDHATFQKSLHKNIKSICIWNCVGNNISHHLFLFLCFICFFRKFCWLYFQNITLLTGGSMFWDRAIVYLQVLQSLHLTVWILHLAVRTAEQVDSLPKTGLIQWCTNVSALYFHWSHLRFTVGDTL